MKEVLNCKLSGFGRKKKCVIKDDISHMNGKEVNQNHICWLG